MKNLGKKSKIGLLWDLSGSLLKQLIFLVVTIILARILGPKEYGLIAMALVFIHIAHVFTDAGFTSGLIQQKNTKDIALSSIFYINLVISILLSILIILLAPFIADFYEEPRLVDVLIYLSIVPPIAALGRVQSTILTKVIDFKSLTIRGVISSIVSGGLGILAALNDYGVYSLVIQQISGVAISTILLWYATKWRPKLEFSMFEVKRLFSYSSYVFLDVILRQTFNKIDTVFIGKVFSPVILGFYSRAETLKSQVQSYTTQSLSKVIFPVLSTLQDNDEGFLYTYLKVFKIITGLIVFIVAPLYFLSHFIIMLLLGPKWEQSVIIFQLLILTLITTPQINVMGKAILAKGHSKLKFHIGLIQRLIKLSPIAVGLFYGIVEFTLAIVLSSFLIFFITILILEIKLKISFWLHLKNFLIPNFLFFSFIVLHFFFKNDINQWIFAFAFLLIQLLIMILIEHDSYIFVKNNFSILFKKFKRK